MRADRTHQQFKTEIKSWLKLQGKDYAWLAEKCEVSESTLRNWLSKKIIPPEKITAIQNITAQIPLSPPLLREIDRKSIPTTSLQQQKIAPTWQSSIIINILIGHLYKQFSLYPIPDPEGIIFPNDWEANEDCAILRGRSWEQIQSEEFQLHWSVLSWINADYFHYYLPSVVLLSLQEIKSSKHLSNMELPVDSVFYYITLGNIFDEKWKLFSLKQLKFIQIWHYLILRQENNAERKYHINNMKNLISRLYPSSTNNPL